MVLASKARLSLDGEYFGGSVHPEDCKENILEAEKS